MTILAEIGDKMWSVHQAFGAALILALFTSGLGGIRWWLAAPSLIVAGYVNHELWMEMQAPGVWNAILHELGWRWVIGNFLALNSAFVLCWLGVWMLHHKRIRTRRAADGCCLSCGYNLTGNISGVCPECGTVILKHE